MGTIRWLDLLVIFCYMSALILVGVRFSRRQTSTERYFVAKRPIPTLDGGKIWNLGLYNFPYHNYMIDVFGHLIVFAGGYLASFVFPNRDAESRHLTLWGWLEKSQTLK
jgi:hypothetical protein